MVFTTSFPQRSHPLRAALCSLLSTPLLAVCVLLAPAIGVAQSISAPAAAGISQETLPAPVLQALMRAGVPADAMAVAVAPLQRGAATLVSVQAQRAMQPASTLKVLTAAVALDRLGPNLRGHTELRSAAPLQRGVLQGELIIRGGADPELSLAQLWA